jgi:hypothetical protein
VRLGKTFLSKPAKIGLVKVCSVSSWTQKIAPGPFNKIGDNWIGIRSEEQQEKKKAEREKE